MNQKFKHMGLGKQMLLTLAYLLSVTLIVMAYECNFRANLIKTKMEKAVDSDKDLDEAERPLCFGRRSMLLQYFSFSPFPHQRSLADRAKKEDCFFDCTSNLCPSPQQILEILQAGKSL